ATASACFKGGIGPCPMTSRHVSVASSRACFTRSTSIEAIYERTRTRSCVIFFEKLGTILLCSKGLSIMFIYKEFSTHCHYSLYVTTRHMLKFHPIGHPKVP